MILCKWGWREVVPPALKRTLRITGAEHKSNPHDPRILRRRHTTIRLIIENARDMGPKIRDLARLASAQIEEDLDAPPPDAIFREERA